MDALIDVHLLIFAQAIPPPWHGRLCKTAARIWHQPALSGMAKNTFFLICKKTLPKTYLSASTQISMAHVSICPYHSVLPRKSPWCVRHPWGPLCWMNWSDACTTGSCCAWTKGPCTTWAVALDLCDSDVSWIHGLNWVERLNQSWSHWRMSRIVKGLSKV